MSEINYRWQCRRGMLELDLLLNNFVDKKVDVLTQQQKKSFELLFFTALIIFEISAYSKLFRIDSLPD